MALTPSTMLPLGTKAPDFTLPDPSGESVSLSDFSGKPALVVMFICNHCPFVQLLRAGLAEFGRDMAAKGVGVVAINANDTSTHPDDSPEKMAEEIRNQGYTFPYLFDESQEVAKSYHAACTPDFFLFDGDQKLVYRGQFDGARPNSDVEVTGEDLRAAVDAVLGGQKPAETQSPSIGCNIKWREGNAPEYFGS